MLGFKLNHVSKRGHCVSLLIIDLPWIDAVVGFFSEAGWTGYQNTNEKSNSMSYARNLSVVKWIKRWKIRQQSFYCDWRHLNSKLETYTLQEQTMWTISEVTEALYWPSCHDTVRSSIRSKDFSHGFVIVIQVPWNEIYDERGGDRAFSVIGVILNCKLEI